MDYSIKTSAAILFLISFFCFCPASGAVTVGGIIDSDTSWTAAETIIVASDVTIALGGHLTIQPGAVIRFIPGTGIIVEGQLTADGLSGNRILFTAMADTTGGSPSVGSWQGVSFLEYSSGVLRGSDLRYANSCVQISGASPEVDDCTITNFLSTGVYIDVGSAIVPLSPTVANCTIGQTKTSLKGTGKGIYVYGRVNLTVTGSVIADCLYGLEFYSSASSVPTFQITDCTIRGNAARGIYTHPG